MILSDTVFPARERAVITNELLSGGESEQQLKDAIASNFLLWEKPTEDVA